LYKELELAVWKEHRRNTGMDPTVEKEKVTEDSPKKRAEEEAEQRQQREEAEQQERILLFRTFRSLALSTLVTMAVVAFVGVASWVLPILSIALLLSLVGAIGHSTFVRSLHRAKNVVVEAVLRVATTIGREGTRRVKYLTQGKPTMHSIGVISVIGTITVYMFFFFFFETKSGLNEF